MTRNCIISTATRDDYAEVSDVMFDAVRNGTSQYSEAQREQWMPRRQSGDDWVARLDRQHVIVARRSSAIVGFMSLDQHGYIDLAYIRPEAQGTGLFRLLFLHIEQMSLDRGHQRLWTHSSLMAQPAFAAMGFCVVEHQIVTIGGQHLKRTEMAKQLCAAHIGQR